MTPNTDALPPMPERDSTKPAEQQGLFRKFIVTRTDGSSEPGGKHEHCEYFVLDVDHDPHAAAALTAYAAAVEATHPELAADMRARYALAAAQQGAQVPKSPAMNIAGAALIPPSTESGWVSSCGCSGSERRINGGLIRTEYKCAVHRSASPQAQAEQAQRPALVTALRGLLASLSRVPTEFELRAAAHEFTVMADRAAVAARAGGDDA